MKIALVTGGTAGVGRATVSALLDKEYRVAVLARGKDRLDEMQTQYGDRVWTRVCDVSKDSEVQEAADALVSYWGTPDVWVNNAMLTSVSPFDEVDEDEFRKITETTYYGHVNGCRAALRVMTKGNIVNVGSGLSYRGLPYQAAYCGAKHAINGFSQSLRAELIHQGRPIEISLVQLPAINTPQFDWSRNRLDVKPQPAPPIFQPEVAAQAVMKAIEGDAREMLVGRSVLQLIFGNMLFPDVLDQQLGKQGVEMQRSEQKDWGRADNIDGPLPDYPAKAHGSFDHKAEGSGIIVDADRTRKAVALTGAALLVAAGALAGRTLAPRRKARPVVVDRQDGDDAGRIDDQDRHAAWGAPRVPVARFDGRDLTRTT
ncbi:SDR family oxidoreductase [Jannaschia sp. LMIT008]|uniref:SDR family oxidoreductase n=1 Tax=Jannaschia maritima TaxID=3032585 RepID=UPI0028114E51|nr:SDR family oxidoreductase [Jannaschia sp. LMIT008]